VVPVEFLLQPEISKIRNSSITAGTFITSAKLRILRDELGGNSYFRVKYPAVRSSIVFLALILIMKGYSQKVLILEKTGHHRWYIYKTGDDIRFETKKESFHVTGSVSEISDTSLVVPGTGNVSFNDICSIIRIYKNRKTNGIRLMVAGGILTGITCVNNLAYHQTMLDPVYLAISGGIIAGGAVWSHLSKRHYRIGGKWKLKVLDYDQFR
jgi:hypothetical protein